VIVIRKSVFYIFFLLIVMTMPATGQSWQEDMTKCNSANQDARITGCTALIEASLLTKIRAGLLPPEKLSVIYGNRGYSYEQKGDFDHAIQDFNEAIRLNPNDEDAYEVRGLAFKMKGDQDHAVQDFSRAIQLKPNFDKAFYDRGNAYINMDDFDLAIRDLDEAIRLKPTDAHALNNRGTAYTRKGDYVRAIQDYTAAIRLNSNYTAAYGSRGYAYFLQSNLPAAIADFLHTVSAEPSSSAALKSVLMLHVMLRRQGRGAQQLSQVAASADLSKWPGPLLKFDLGQMTADEAMVAATSHGTDREKKWQSCEVDYFTGEEALLHHQQRTATVRLESARDSCPTGNLFYSAALMELKRLGATATSQKK
jgi:tetratricopeptide (TPR) repeat protein